MATVELQAARRTVQGKKVRFLRREGLIPANLYAPGETSVSLQFPAKETEAALRRISSTMLVPLNLPGQAARRVLVREVQRHPVSERVLHIDLFAVSMTETMRTAISLRFTGEASAIAQLDGTLIHNLDTVEVEALPADLPPNLEVDLSTLTTLDAVVRVGDLTLPPGVTLLTPPESVVVSIAPPRLAAEIEAEAAAATPAEAAAAPAEEGGAEESAPAEENE
jgi:large subunit ribosomal protein L25